MSNAPVPADSLPEATLRGAQPGAGAQGVLVVAAERPEGGAVWVFDAERRVVSAVTLQPGQTLALQLAPGTYTIVDADGGSVRLPIAAGQVARVAQRPGGLGGAVVEGPVAPAAVALPPAPPEPPPSGKSQWKKPVAPLLSALIPGVGQMVNRQPARGVGFLFGSLALGLGAYALARTRGGLDGAGPGEHGDTFNTQVIGAAGFGLLTGALHLLYMGQVLDAYAGASGRTSPSPATRHKVSLELTRMATVGLRAGDPAAAFYADWNVGVLGQVARRFSVGATDLGIKPGAGKLVLQGGVRLHVRVLERRRLWLGLGAGAIFQGALATGESPPVAAGERAPRTATFAAIPYGQIDLRLFILDRWSINLIPRVSAPLVGARHYRGDGAIPKHAVTFELGTGMGVYF